MGGFGEGLGRVLGGVGGSWAVLGRCFGGTFLRWCAAWAPRGLLESISVPSGLVLGGVWEGFGEVLHDFVMVFRFCFLHFVSLLCFALLLWFWLCFALFSLFAFLCLLFGLRVQNRGPALSGPGLPLQVFMWLAGGDIFMWSHHFRDVVNQK